MDLRFYFFQSSIVNLILLKWYGEDDQNIITASESTTGKDANFKLKEEELKKNMINALDIVTINEMRR